MRRICGRLVLCLALITAFDWSDLPPLLDHTVAQVRAQQFAPVPAFGTIMSSNASISAVNSTAEFSAYQFTISPGYLATGTTVGATASPYYTGGTASTMNTPVLQQAPQPLHLRMLGTIQSGAATGFNIGVNLGGTQATVSLNPTVIAATNADTPIRLDVWLVPLAALNATAAAPNTSNTYSFWLAARLEVPLGGGAIGGSATQTIINIATLSSVNTASPNQLNVLMRWGTAAAGTGATWRSRLLRIGE